MSNNERNIKKPGRPEGCGHRGRTVYTGKCDVRLTAEKDRMLTRLAERNNVTRSEIMRKAFDDFARFNECEEDCSLD